MSEDDLGEHEPRKALGEIDLSPAAPRCASPLHVWDQSRRVWQLKCDDCGTWITVDSELAVMVRAE